MPIVSLNPDSSRSYERERVREKPQSHTPSLRATPLKRGFFCDTCSRSPLLRGVPEGRGVLFARLPRMGWVFTQSGERVDDRPLAHARSYMESRGNPSVSPP